MFARTVGVLLYRSPVSLNIRIPVLTTYTMSKEGELFQIVKEGFTDGSHYDKYRPDYTPETTTEIVNMLTANHKTAGGGECDILELGSGTGKLTKHLMKKLPTNRTFVASEPMPDFLKILQKNCPGVQTMQCNADSIPLPDNSVQGIVAAQSFHWFANESSVNEIHRVLKPNGSFVVVWNVPDLKVDWVTAFSEKCLSYYAEDEPQYMRFWWKDFMDKYSGFKLEVRKHLDYPTAQYTMEEMFTFISTFSAFASMSEEKRSQVFEELSVDLRTDPSTAGKSVIHYPRIVDVVQYVKQ